MRIAGEWSGKIIERSLALLALGRAIGRERMFYNLEDAVAHFRARGPAPAVPLIQAAFDPCYSCSDP